MKSKEELPMNSDRGASQLQFDFGDEGETKPLAKLLRQEPTDPAHVDQPSLSLSLGTVPK